VHAPPLLDELGERLAASVEVGKRAGALERPQLALVRARVTELVERLAALGSALIAPSDALDAVAGAVASRAVTLLDHLALLVGAPPRRP